MPRNEHDAARRTWAPHLIAVVVAAFALGATPLGAQSRGGLSGTIRDEAGLPIENALVALDASTARQIARTDSTGRFHIDRVTSGKHDVAVAAIGYLPDVRTVVVGDALVDVTIVLRRNTAIIDTLHILARRTGILGTVMTHVQFAPLADAEVDVIGAPLDAKTGADGRFAFPDIRRGAYVIQVKRNGYATRMLSVVVPKDSAIELAIAMDEGSGGDKRLAMPLYEFDARRRWMSFNHAALVPRQELAGHGGQKLAEALRYSMSYLMKGLVIDDSACVYVNGIFQQAMTVKDYLVSDIEAVEVYGFGADGTATVTYANGHPPTRLPPHAQCGMKEPSMSLSTQRGFGRVRARPNPARVEAVVIWLKR